jgi:hypothetical protein
MKKSRKPTTLSIEEARRLLGAEAPVSLPGAPSDFLSLQGLASITRNRLVSSGGRPSDPAWTVSRKVPMKAETWQKLDRYAQSLQEQEIRISPGQVAAIALERGLELAIVTDNLAQREQLTEPVNTNYEFSAEAWARAKKMKQPMALYDLF